MRPLKVTLEGDYWDCWIYRDRLYLWRMDGSVSILDWPAMAISLVSSEDEKLVFEPGLLAGSYLYDPKLSLFLHDARMRKDLATRFEKARRRRIAFDEKALSRFELARLDNPFSSLPNDTEIYDKRVYASTDTGVFSTGCARPRSSKRLMGKRLQKLWDARVLSLAAKSQRLAMASGDDGVFECATSFGRSRFGTDYRSAGASIVRVDPEANGHGGVYRLSERPTSSATWAYSSVYANSRSTGPFLIGFDWQREDDELTRAFVGTYSQKDIFGVERPGFGFGADERLYLVDAKGNVRPIRFMQRGLQDDVDDSDSRPFQALGRLESGLSGTILTGGTASFGIVVEEKERLRVLRSDGEVEVIDGPVTRWRVYPRSVNYGNHLHVVLEDRLEIYAFLHDYFVAQPEKAIGLPYSERRGSS